MSRRLKGSAPDQTTHHLHHEWNGDGLISDQIVEEIAEYENEDRGELPPLNKSINPVALDTAFEAPDDDTTMAGCITFSYYGYTVLAQSTGQVLIKKS
ncbi:HalOD1 output domain-containing protein [Natrinema sp. SYSU A 869]|uniref:HalOD1 output domain-containing protein n=1 Tax=Natrinema sp. SYSU A 869 TaxID=2871694 RepID=UPI001CA3CA28|nr:HalOD1 output domain-containing protein [Natrinema sp. SYSU A 869]